MWHIDRSMKNTNNSGIYHKHNGCALHLFLRKFLFFSHWKKKINWRRFCHQFQLESEFDFVVKKLSMRLSLAIKTNYSLWDHEWELNSVFDGKTSWDAESALRWSPLQTRHLNAIRNMWAACQQPEAWRAIWYCCTGSGCYYFYLFVDLA